MTGSALLIETGSRLHFGPLSYQPQQGRHFGGLGLMIGHPGVRLRAQVSAAGGVGDSGLPPRMQQLLATLRANRPEFHLPIDWRLEQKIPSHAGLGSGTQLALAVTEALAVLHGVTLSAVEVARLALRGERSAIGIFGYQEGGLLVDAGHRSANSLGELAVRIPLPDEWRVLLVTPCQTKGLHGAEERQVFATLPPMPDGLTGEQCRLVLTELLPALHMRDFPAFAAALELYGTRVGEFFASSQGGVYSSPVIRSLAERLHGAGIEGYAQSSWGPTLAIPAHSEAHLEELREKIERLPEGEHCQLLPTTPRNTGRRLQWTEPVH
ncbi:GHMP family kinase ATP-binding protein [Planctomicrobium sp. SH664]|uniref:GHMP family kinase ATP-binding protein n=1 Tax=Planctomicrobium sp. SH664 TaxID=3448125 RepID=UPI003F5CA62A